MPRDLFDDVHRPIVHVQSGSRYTVPLSLAAHALAVLAVIAATIVGPAVLPGLATSSISDTVGIAPEPDAKGRRQKAEGRRQKAEGKRQKAEGRTETTKARRLQTAAPSLRVNPEPRTLFKPPS